MDELFQECLQEISIHGLEGCSFSKMIENISSSNSTIKFDNFMEKKLFSILRDEPDVSIFQPAPINHERKLNYTSEGVLYFSERILHEKSELTELTEEIKKNSIFVTSYDLRLRALGISKSTRKSLSDVQFGIIEGTLDFFKILKKLEKRKLEEPTKMNSENFFPLTQEI
jgi:hypothetical protein